jgi:hypothetical protein
MAQEVGYFKDNVIYEEGPFVIVNAMFNGWRIECELKGHKCPVLPDWTIYKLLDNWNCPGKTHKKEAVRICDMLNDQVILGKIVLKDRCWICSAYDSL